jgi:hypothetical protein
MRVKLEYPHLKVDLAAADEFAGNRGNASDSKMLLQKPVDFRQQPPHEAQELSLTPGDRRFKFPTELGSIDAELFAKIRRNALQAEELRRVEVRAEFWRREKLEHHLQAIAEEAERLRGFFLKRLLQQQRFNATRLIRMTYADQQSDELIAVNDEKVIAATKQRYRDATNEGFDVVREERVTIRNDYLNLMQMHAALAMFQNAALLNQGADKPIKATTAEREILPQQRPKKSG